MSSSASPCHLASSYYLRSRKKNVGPSNAGIHPQARRGGNVNEIENVAENQPEIETAAASTGNSATAQNNGTPHIAIGNPPSNTKRAILIKIWMAMAHGSMFLMLFFLKHTHFYEKLKFERPNFFDLSELMAFGMGCAFVVYGLHRLSGKINFSLGPKTKYSLKFGIDCTMLYMCVKLNQFMQNDIWGLLVVFNLSLHAVVICQVLHTREGIVDAFVAVCMSIGMHLKNHNSWTKPVVISACILLTAVKDLNLIQCLYNLLGIRKEVGQGDDNQQRGNVNMV